MNNNNIVYSIQDGCYYLSMPYYVHDFEGSSDSILPNKIRLGEDLSTFEKLADDSFRQLTSADGKMFYISSDGKLICWNNGNEFDVLDAGAAVYYVKESIILDLERTEYCVDGDFVFYTDSVQEGIWRKEIGSGSPAIKLPIEKVFGFQASGGVFFYHDGESIYRYANGISTTLLTLSADGAANRISSFLVDGVLLYLTGSSELYIADGEKIAERIISYTIYHGLIYYSTDDGLFTYDPIEKNTKQIISTIYRHDRIFHFYITYINIQNNRLFLSIHNGSFGSALCIYTANPDGSDFRPLINTQTPVYQTFTYPEQGFSVNYPFGYTVHFDPGSTYYSRLLMIDLMHDFFINAFNMRVMFEEDEEFIPVFIELTTVEDTIAIVTDQGHEGYYQIELIDERFQLSFYLEDFYFKMAGPEEFYDVAEPIFIEMVKSFRILEYE